MRILIIGGTSGIGYYVGEELALRGHKVIITTHNEKERENLHFKTAKLNLDISIYKLDVTSTNDLKILDDIEYDIVWINHALGYGSSVLDSDIDKVRELYEVNVFSYIKIIKRVVESFNKRNISGRIIVSSSLAAHLNIEYFGIYSSSKAALSEICYTLNRELKLINSNIKLTLLELGAYHTGFNQFMIENIGVNKERKRLRKLFLLIEKKNYNDICGEIVSIIEKDVDIFRIKRPILQAIFVKLYSAFFR